ncbi:MAG: UvrD-helicase domain-containing protein [Nitrospirales bacterium]
MTNNLSPLPDADARRIGETTFDRNVVVLAGAGTGKTTLLVNRLLHALLREPHPLRITEMVALTFTNKAANEMKGRLREALHELLAACQSPSLTGDSAKVKLEEFQERYHVSTDHIQEKVTCALNDLEKAHIATLHSFAAHVLRLYPLECGVDPHFQEDDGTQFLEIFSGAWTSWIDEAFGEQGAHHAQWREILDVVDLKGIREFALALCDDLIALRDLQAQLDSVIPSPAVGSWLQRNRQAILRLLQEYAHPKPRKIEKMLAVAERVFDLMAQEGWVGVNNVEGDERALLSSAVGQAPKGWSPEDFLEARRIVQNAHRLVNVDERFLNRAIRLLEPFVQHVRRLYANKGWIRFDGLIVRVRDVLRDYPRVREQLKADFQAIMIDEFQDTDPLQYEILLFLGEQFGDHCRQWDAIRLVPGKLFIVGDPKQSIYAFRRADIQAFDHVVRKLTEDGGVVCTLTTNFRSGPEVLEVVNAVFDRVFVQEDHVQPSNVPLMVGRREEEGLPSAGVELCVIGNAGEEEWDAERATRVEAEWLAVWILEQLSSGQQWVLEKGIRTSLRPGHVAVLFRKFTNAHVYLEAMQRRGIPYLTDGERHFYRRQEVIDLVNVLRVFEDPTDGIAIVGILRSSLGGVPDQEIMELAKLGLLDIRRTDTLDHWGSTRKPVVRLLFEQLAALHAQAKRLPLSEFIDRVFANLPIVELAAASSHGEQAVMNLWKLRDLMAAQAAVPHLSFSGWVHRLVDCLMTHPPEPEASLEEESLDAVRVLSIHKAKGLEFPVVILPGLHQKSAGMDRGAEVTVDWMSGVYGCTFPPTWNAGQVLLWEKERIREKAEQRRVMYVGMTRARDRLLLSGGQLTKPIGESFLGFLQHVVDGEVGNPAHATVQIGEAAIRQTVVTFRDLPPSETVIPSTVPEIADQEGGGTVSFEKYHERERAWQQASKEVDFMTPSLLQPSRAKRRPNTQQGGLKLPGQFLGTLVHRLLEQWDFHLYPENFREPLRKFCLKELPSDLDDDEKNAFMLEIEDLMAAFLQSSSYRELQQATVLGREVPFAMPWSHQVEKGSSSCPCVMEGVMDVVYELAGNVWVGDYKTDRVTAAQLGDYARAYQLQGQVYAMAASRSLGLNVKGCKLVFLRIGETVSVMTDVNTCR